MNYYIQKEEKNFYYLYISAQFKHSEKSFYDISYLLQSKHSSLDSTGTSRINTSRIDLSPRPSA